MNREELIKLAIVKEKKDEKIVRTPNQMNGVDMSFEDIENCTIWVLDRTSQILLDRLRNCKVIIGPCEGSVFFRECVDCEFRVISKQLRTRDCKNCSLYLHLPSQPSIEASSDLRFGKWNVSYPQLCAQFDAAGFDIDVPNKYSDIYDFTEEGAEGKPLKNDEEAGEEEEEEKKNDHWEIIGEEEAKENEIQILELEDEFGKIENLYEVDGEEEEEEEADSTKVDEVELEIKEEEEKDSPPLVEPKQAATKEKKPKRKFCTIL